MKKPFFKIKKEDFDNMTFDSAMLLTKFDVTGKTPVAKEDVVCMTTGDISVSCVPDVQDLGEDVNGCPPNLAELVQIGGWDCKVGITALTATDKAIKEALGFADVGASGKVTPRSWVNTNDFANRWIVAQKMNGGYVAILLKKAISSAGLSFKTTKVGKGQLSIELSGHPSIDDDNPFAPPIEFYSTTPSSGV